MDRLSIAFFAAAVLLAGTTVAALTLRTGARVADASIPVRFEGVIASGSTVAGPPALRVAPAPTLVAAAPARPVPAKPVARKARVLTQARPELPAVAVVDVAGIAEVAAAQAEAQAEAHACRRQVERAKAWVRRVEHAQSTCTEAKTLTRRVVVLTEVDPIEG